MSLRERRACRALALPALPLAGAAVLIFSFSLEVGAAGAAAPRAARIAPSVAVQARHFWTPARMRQAKPLEVHVDRETGVVPALSGERREGAPHRIPPVAPWRAASASSTFGAVPDPTVEGMRQNGVVFFRVGFSLARCSGTSVNAPNLSVVFTAAHCVDSGGPKGHPYKSEWVFVPGYRYGQRPFGVFPAKWLGATPEWVASGSENGDVGAAVVTRNESGQRLARAVGGAGIAWNLKANQVFDVHGYPVGPPFDGETQRLCAQTPFLGHDLPSFAWSGPLNLAVECDVTGGASGGGWTIDGNLLNSVTDYGYSNDPTTDFGPYFGEDVARLYRRAGSIR
jgi:V8-like Glu-specific endopeptidase